MATFEITSPSGDKYRVTGETAQGAHAALMKMLGQTATAEPKRSLKLGSLRENIVGDGDVDTVGEYIGEAIQSAGAGMLRGIRGALELPEMAGRLGVRAGQAALGTEARTPILDTATGRALTKGYEGLASAVGADPSGIEYKSPTTVGQYAGTIGEFGGGGLGLGATAKGVAKLAGGQATKVGRGADVVAKSSLGPSLERTAITAGIGSEAAGQATEGTVIEPAARLVGAFLAPAAVSGVKNKTVQAFRKKATDMPALDVQRASKDAAYKAFEGAGGKVSVKMDDVAAGFDRLIENDDMFIAYSRDAAGSEYVKAALDAIQKHAGKEFNLAQLDKLRSGMGSIYKQSGFDPRVRFLRDKLDDIIDRAPVTADGDASALLKVARAENRKYRKIEAFDEEMLKAELGAASSGSGGNIVNSYRRAVKSILTSKNKRAKFDPDELEIMQKFVEGSMGENFMRLVGKLSPSGNGLMAALNLGAIVNDPRMAAATVAGMTAKSRADKRAVQSVEGIRDMIISGVKPSQRKDIDQDIRVLLGLTPQIPQEQ
jgi:hypothetical protein